jgi:hypothetical protein
MIQYSEPVLLNLNKIVKSNSLQSKHSGKNFRNSNLNTKFAKNLRNYNLIDDRGLFLLTICKHYINIAFFFLRVKIAFQGVWDEKYFIYTTANRRSTTNNLRRNMCASDKLMNLIEGCP